MSKSQHKIITLNVQGSDKAVVGTEEMFESVIDALRSQFPKLKIESTTYVGDNVNKPFLMVPTKLHKLTKEA